MDIINWKKNEVVKYCVEKEIDFMVYGNCVYVENHNYKKIRNFMEENKELGFPFYGNVLSGVMIAKI